MTFDPTITLGAILNFLGLVGGVIGVYVAVSNRITTLETMLTPMWDWWNRDDGNGNGKTQFDTKIEHAVRTAVTAAVAEVLRQDRAFRERGG